MMFRNLFSLAVLSLILSSATDAHAADWMYRRSWFSHNPVPMEMAGAADGPGAVMHSAPEFPVPEPRSAYRPAIPQRGPGFSVRGAYRYNVYRLFSGQSQDTTIFRQFHYEQSP